MRKEFIVERQGRSFVLYSGLLDMAHQQGLKTIRTELIQTPSEANNRVAICTATVVLEKDGVERVFTGIGDAAPNNVAPAMQTCLIRMAETRSKARALRDAVNVGVAAFEELGEEDAHDGAPERGYRISAPSRPRMERTAPPVSTPRSGQGNGTAHRAAPKESAPAVGAENAVNSSAGRITEAQIEAIRSLCRRKELDADAVARDKFEIGSVSELSQLQGSELIRALNERANGRAPVTP